MSDNKPFWAIHMTKGAVIRLHVTVMAPTTPIGEISDVEAFCDACTQGRWRCAWHACDSHIVDFKVPDR